VFKFKNKYDSQFVVKFDHGTLLISVWCDSVGEWVTFNKGNSESQFKIDVENNVFQFKSWSIRSNILLNFKYSECKKEVDKFMIYLKNLKPN